MYRMNEKCTVPNRANGPKLSAANDLYSALKPMSPAARLQHAPLRRLVESELSARRHRATVDRVDDGCKIVSLGIDGHTVRDSAGVALEVNQWLDDEDFTTDDSQSRGDRPPLLRPYLRPAIEKYTAWLRESMEGPRGIAKTLVLLARDDRSRNLVTGILEHPPREWTPDDIVKKAMDWVRVRAAERRESMERMIDDISRLWAKRRPVCDIEGARAELQKSRPDVFKKLERYRKVYTSLFNCGATAENWYRLWRRHVEKKRKPISRDELFAAVRGLGSTAGMAVIEPLPGDNARLSTGAVADVRRSCRRPSSRARSVAPVVSVASKGKSSPGKPKANAGRLAAKIPKKKIGRAKR